MIMKMRLVPSSEKEGEHLQAKGVDISSIGEWEETLSLPTRSAGDGWGYLQRFKTAFRRYKRTWSNLSRKKKPGAKV